MKRRHLTLICLVLLLSVCGVISAPAYAAAGGFWEQRDGKWYYSDDGGEYQTGWQKIEGTWYYFDENGVMQTGRQMIAGKEYLLDDSGRLRTGWLKISGKWNYYSDQGQPLTGWQSISDKWYYFNGRGVMQTGWQSISDRWYYFNCRGVMQTGWQSISDKWYYFNSRGVMQTGWQELDGEWYYFNSRGIMTQGWSEIDEKWYYFDTAGHMQRDTWIDGYHVNADGVWVKEPPRSVRLDVKCIYQRPELPNGCEVTSLTIVLNYLGYSVSKGTMSDRYLPKGSIGRTSPYQAFIGNPRNRNSWYCYSPVIVRCANSYLGSVKAKKKAVDLTGSSFETLYQELEQGRPVIIWGTLGMGNPHCISPWRVNGVRYERYVNLHCLVLTGYDKDKDLAYIADPLRGNTTYKLSVVKRRYEQLHSQAVVIRDTE